MWNLKQFQEIYSRYESSGLKVHDFCANEVINEAKFYYWQKKLREEAVSPKGFAPIVLDTQNPSASMSSLVSNSINLSDCEIVYPWGTTIRLKGVVSLELVQVLIHLTH